MNRSCVTVSAYAKVNLGLSVGPLRADGYHDIETVFQSVGLSDTLHIEENGGETDVLAVSGLSVPTGPENLAMAALERLRSCCAVPALRVTLEKRIPVAAGLGGGSSDAAAVLAGARELFDLEVDDDQLARVALEVGSDVPFFLVGGTARGRGRGELLEPLPSLRGVFFLIAAIDEPVRAAEAYARVRIGLTDDAVFIRLICSAIRERDHQALATALRNDLEPGVVSLCPRVSAMRAELLQAGAEGAIMSGSGPAVLGIFDREDRANAAASSLRQRGHTVYVAEPIDVGYRISTP